MTLRQLLKGIALTEEFGEFFVRRVGVISTYFGPLLRKYGKPASKYIIRMEAAFENFMVTGSRTSYATFWHNYSRLYQMGSSLNANEQIQVGLELERRAETLLAKDSDFGKVWAQEIQKAERLRLAAKAAEKTASLSGERAALNSLLRQARKDGSALFTVWMRFKRVVSPNSPYMQAAMRIAKNDASEIKRVIKHTKGSVRKKALLGYMVRVRGMLGEGYALLNKIWLARAAEHLADARRIARQLGSDWEAREITQAANDILLNGLEGPDALIVLVNWKTSEAILHTAAQVKVAKVSEAVQQTIKDWSRGVGREATKEFPLGTLTFRLTPDSLPRTFTMGIRKEIRPNYYILNAGGGTLPAKDLKLLSELGGLLEEVEMDMSVDQLTHLAVSLMEAVLKAN